LTDALTSSNEDNGPTYSLNKPLCIFILFG